MIVRKISTRRFARHESADVELPAAGIVVVTGENGHGKSTLVEAVAQGVWNETLRGAPGWRANANSGVEIAFVDGFVRRSVSGSTHALRWQCSEDDGAAEYPTRSKSQAALESRVGSFGVWRHACTFHTDDAARFTRATDADRKRLLEEVLELDRLEAGYRAAREGANGERAVLNAWTRDAEMQGSTRAGVVGRLALLAGEDEEAPDLDTLRSDAVRLRDAMAEANAVSSDMDQGRALAYGVAQVAADRASAAGIALENFDALGPTCGACRQAIDGEHAAEVRAQLAAELEALEGDAGRARAAADAWAADASARLAEAASARADYVAIVATGNAAAAAHRRNAARETKRVEISQELSTLDGEISALATRVAAQEIKVHELDAAVAALSFRGVRAALLAAAIEALQDLANDWLSRLGLDAVEVRLSSQTESKSGTVADKISLDVTGAGGGYGYKGASTGERRRIDIAFMLALGELAADSRGLSPESTLFMDEVFDGLDLAGTEAAVALLREISQTRCVVVISHSADLVERLGAVLHLVAVDGGLAVAG